MATAKRRWCPHCGGTRFETRGSSHVSCSRCGEVGRPGYFEGDFPEQRCKKPGCGERFPRKHWSIVSGFRDFREELLKGFIRCPQCKGRHRATNVRVGVDALGTESHFGEFGEYVPES